MTDYRFFKKMMHARLIKLIEKLKENKCSISLTAVETTDDTGIHYDVTFMFTPALDVVIGKEVYNFYIDRDGANQLDGFANSLEWTSTHVLKGK